MKTFPSFKTISDAVLERANRYGVLAVLLAAAVFYLFCWDRFPFGYFVDDGGYVSLARSLLKGHYLNSYLPGSPPATDRLPGYPLLLSLFLGLRVPPEGLKILSVGFSLATAGLIAFHIKGWASVGLRAFFLALCLFHPLTVYLSGAVLAEPFFLFLVTLMLVSAARARSVKSPWGLAGVCSAAAAVLVRPEGVFLPLALVMTNRRGPLVRGVVLAGGAAGALVLGVLLSGAGGAGATPSYFQVVASLKNAGLTFVENLRVMGSVLTGEILWPNIFSGFRGKMGGWAAAGGALIVTAAGWRWLGKQEGAMAKPLAAFGALYVALHVLFPVTQARYFLVAVPWICLGMAVGVSRLSRGKGFVGLLLIAPALWFGVRAAQDRVQRAAHARFP